MDPANGFALTPAERQADELADLRRGQRRAEASTPAVQVGAGAPTSAPRDGTLYVDMTAARLYVRAGGAWRYVALT